MTVFTEEEFLTQHGASFDFGEPGLHKNAGQASLKVWGRKVAAQDRKDCLLEQRRFELRAEYRRLVEAGEIRAPTRIEQREKTAAGHPDNPSVQAARRILAREGIPGNTLI